MTRLDIARRLPATGVLRCQPRYPLGRRASRCETAAAAVCALAMLPGLLFSGLPEAVDWALGACAGLAILVVSVCTLLLRDVAGTARSRTDQSFVLRVDADGLLVTKLFGRRLVDWARLGSAERLGAHEWCIAWNDGYALLDERKEQERLVLDLVLAVVATNEQGLLVLDGPDVPPESALSRLDGTVDAGRGLSLTDGDGE